MLFCKNRLFYLAGAGPRRCLRVSPPLFIKSAKARRKFGPYAKARKALCFFCALCLAWLHFPSFARRGPLSDKETAAALRVFEKAVMLSPELVGQSRGGALRPFYKVNGHKIYLNEGFWDLTRAWLRIYIDEIEKSCACDLDPDLMIQEAKDYLPEGFFKQKILDPGINLGGGKFSRWSAELGYSAAVLKAAVEAAETVLSVFVGLKGLHFMCRLNDVMVISVMRKMQKYGRVFSYSRKMRRSSLLSSLKALWISHLIRKSQKRVFFSIDQALAFRQEELEKVSAEGPKSFFRKKSHRLIWIEALKRKTDPLLAQIAEWRRELESSKLDFSERRAIEGRIQRAERKIERIASLNRKDFFGDRFKRHLLLRSRKGRWAYMSGSALPDQIAGKSLFWPLSFQENIIERAVKARGPESALLENLSSRLLEPSEGPSFPPDEVIDGLIEEFLSRHKESEEIFNKESLNEKKQALRFFLNDIEKIFNKGLTSAQRLMQARAVEMALGLVFVRYLDISHSLFSERHEMSFRERMRSQRALGRFLSLTYEFADFLSFIAISNNMDKLEFYKYEAMEKLLAFFDYLRAVQNALNSPSAGKEEFFADLDSKARALRAIPLLKEKKTAFSLMPFRRGQAKCLKLAEKYQ